MLIPKLNAFIGNACKSLILKDVTGAYNAITNIGGYGSPNSEIGDITSVQINIITPTVAYSIIDPIGFPTLDSNFEYEVPTSIISSIPDGIYKIEYILSDGVTTFSYGPKYHVFYCNIKCCVQKLIIDACKIKCDCNNPIVKNAAYANILLLGLEANKECGNMLVVNEILVKLNQICGFTSQDCGCK